MYFIWSEELQVTMQFFRYFALLCNLVFISLPERYEESKSHVVLRSLRLDLGSNARC